MKNFTTKLMADLQSELATIQGKNEDVLKKSELSVRLIETSLNELKKFTLNYTFKEESEEILFFKKQKPQFFSKLIYHVNIYNIESRKPYGEKAIRKYLQAELEELRRFHENNLDLYKYYRTDSDHFDRLYFLRGKQTLSLSAGTYVYEIDQQFSTVFDYNVAKIMANDLLGIYLKEGLAKLEKKSTDGEAAELIMPRLPWTASKTSLIELIYALHAAGAFGQTDIKEIAANCELSLNVELGEIYRTFMEIRIRKQNRTKFLDTLKEALLKYMDEADEK
jgi:hypothetical protein